jgi:NADPH:quinone reductase-like Zn-dependent oxidoreductase
VLRRSPSGGGCSPGASTCACGASHARGCTSLFSYTAKRADLLRSAAELFDVIGRGVVRIEIGQTYPMRDVQQAHRDLQERRTVGSTVLLP